MADRATIPDAVRFAVRHLRVSAARPVSAEEFLMALQGSRTHPAARGALETFINEADPAELADLVASGAVDFPGLATIARACLPLSHPTRTYLESLAA